MTCALLRYRSPRLNVVAVEPKGSKCNLKNLECIPSLPTQIQDYSKTNYECTRLICFPKLRPKKKKSQLFSEVHQNYSSDNVLVNRLVLTPLRAEIYTSDCHSPKKQKGFVSQIQIDRLLRHVGSQSEGEITGRERTLAVRN